LVCSAIGVDSTCEEYWLIITLPLARDVWYLHIDVVEHMLVDERYVRVIW